MHSQKQDIALRPQYVGQTLVTRVIIHCVRDTAVCLQNSFYFLLVTQLNFNFQAS